MDKHKLKLYITGRTSRTESALSALRMIFEQVLEDQYELEVVDVLENPQLAEEAKIVATPTLVKVFPHPTRRIIGDLSDRENLIRALDLHPRLERGAF